MKLPKVKKRISSFLVNEEGQISKQSLISMGAFLVGGGAGVIFSAKDVFPTNGDCNPGPCGYDCDPHSSHSSHANCPNPPNTNPNVEKGCDEGTDGCSDIKPAHGQAWNKDGLKDHNAYNSNGDPIIYGDAKCSNDNQPFHFNGIHFSYTGDVLASQHHHHASHNSY